MIHNEIKHLFPNEEEMHQIQMICELLEPFSIATKILTTSKKCSMGYALIAYRGLEIVLEDQEPENYVEMKAILKKYIKMHDFHSLVPVFLDPQSRDQYFEGTLTSVPRYPNHY